MFALFALPPSQSSSVATPAPRRQEPSRRQHHLLGEAQQGEGANDPITHIKLQQRRQGTAPRPPLGSPPTCPAKYARMLLRGRKWRGSPRSLSISPPACGSRR